MRSTFTSNGHKGSSGIAHNHERKNSNGIGVELQEIKGNQIQPSALAASNNNGGSDQKGSGRGRSQVGNRGPNQIIVL